MLISPSIAVILGDMSTTSTTTHTIVFAKQKHAVGFVADCARWSPRLTDIVRKGKTVTLTAPVDGEFTMDLAEFVGYHGSPPMGPIATLNGNRTPRSY